MPEAMVLEIWHGATLLETVHDIHSEAEAKERFRHLYGQPSSRLECVLLRNGEEVGRF